MIDDAHSLVQLNTPATCAAAISPTLWPTTAAGATPHARHTLANATCSAKSAGCAISVWSRRASASGESIQSTTTSPHTAAAVLRSVRSSRGRSAHAPTVRGPWPTTANLARKHKRDLALRSGAARSVGHLPSRSIHSARERPTTAAADRNGYDAGSLCTRCHAHRHVCDLKSPGK